jgi:hypothetical protein
LCQKFKVFYYTRRGLLLIGVFNHWRKKVFLGKPTTWEAKQKFTANFVCFSCINFDIIIIFWVIVRNRKVKTQIKSNSNVFLFSSKIYFSEDVTFSVTLNDNLNCWFLLIYTFTVFVLQSHILFKSALTSSFEFYYVQSFRTKCRGENWLLKNVYVVVND